MKLSRRMAPAGRKKTRRAFIRRSGSMRSWRNDHVRHSSGSSSEITDRQCPRLDTGACVTARPREEARGDPILAAQHGLLGID